MYIWDTTKAKGFLHIKNNHYKGSIWPRQFDFIRQTVKGETANALIALFQNKISGVDEDLGVYFF